MKKIKNYLLSIGVVIFALIMFLEHILEYETILTHFIKGFSCGLILFGVVILIIMKTKKW